MGFESRPKQKSLPEIREVQKERMKSDVKAVDGGADISEDGKVNFTEEQVKQAQEAMEQELGEKTEGDIEFTLEKHKQTSEEMIDSELFSDLKDSKLFAELKDMVREMGIAGLKSLPIVVLTGIIGAGGIGVALGAGAMSVVGYKHLKKIRERLKDQYQ